MLLIVNLADQPAGGAEVTAQILGLNLERARVACLAAGPWGNCYLGAVPDLEPVKYTLRTIPEQRKYYDSAAATYDDEYLHRRNYDYPDRVAHIWASVSVPSDEPIVDIGCGTGLLGRALGRLTPGVIIDGLDLSRGMLEVAIATTAYRRVHEANLQVGVPELHGTYGGVVSSGTFTIAHLGLEALRPVIDLGRPSALFVLGVNRQHFIDEQWPSALDRLIVDGLIGEWDSIRVPIYGDQLPIENLRCADVVVFRRAGEESR